MAHIYCIIVSSDAISCMDWNADLLATGSWDTTAKVWKCGEINGFKVRLAKDLFAVLEHSSHVTCINLCPDNSQLVTGIVNTNFLTFQRCSRNLFSFVISVGTRDGSVVLWCLTSYNIIQELPAHKRQVNAVKFSPDGTRVISCGSDFYLKVIDLTTGSILFSSGRLINLY